MSEPQKPKIRVFLEGRYRKLVRRLPQTIFYCPNCKGRRRGCARCDGYGKLTKDSVQELIARKVLPRYKARKGRFHGAGREDINVRMLGTGRPFVFEVVHPKNLLIDLDEIVESVNRYGEGRIEITNLVPVNRRRVAELKESPSDKIYRALVGVREPECLDDALALAGRVVDITQRTPKRVAHRRADKQRERRVEILSVAVVDDECVREYWDGVCLAFEVRCEHGTYVKEWISGEEGRTTPSLAQLVGCRTACLALDVLDVIGPFPPLQDQQAPEFEDQLEWPVSDDDDSWDLADASFSVSADSDDDEDEDDAVLSEREDGGAA